MQQSVRVTAYSETATGEKSNRELFEQLQINTLWQRGYTGSNIKIGHLDTGIDASHPSLPHQPFAFQQFDRCGFATTSLKPFDSAHHGTGLASIIGGRPVAGFATGVAPDCQLYSGIVLEHGDLISRILFGMAWMLEHEVHVLCMPLGIPGYTPVFTTLARLLRQRGILIVTAIGNLGAGRSLSPGDYQEVLSIGATDANGAVAKFSGSSHPDTPRIGIKPDILAPGTDVWVAKPGGGYQRVHGTSVACALTAGIAALLLQAAPSASPALIEQALINTSLPLSLNQQHRSRSGLLQPAAALEYVLAEQARAADETVQTARTAHPDLSIGKYSDPRLQKLLQDSHAEYIMEAVFVLAAGDAAGAVLDRAMRISGHTPLRLRYINAANIMIVQAKTDFLRALRDDSRVCIASAVDIDRTRLL